MPAVPVGARGPHADAEGRAAPAGPGFHGKVPTKGDFIARRLPRGFIDPWDDWLQSAMECSREQLGDAWLDAYMNSPLWRFVLSPGLCGDSAMTGVLMPSVDRVNRHFPLTIAAPLGVGVNLASLPVVAAAWFQAAEDLALSSLDEGFDLEDFDQQVEALGLPPWNSAVRPIAGLAEGRAGWRVAVDPPEDAAAGYALMLHQVLSATMPRYSLWWTLGAADVDASLLACPGMPTIGGFAALLDGRWRMWGWSESPPVAGGMMAVVPAPVGPPTNDDEPMPFDEPE